MSVTRACGLVRVTMKRLCHCACLDVQKLCWHAQCWHLSRHEHACPFDMLSERRARLDLCARDAHVGSTGRSVAFVKIHAIVPRSFSLCLSGRTFCARPLVFASEHQKDNISMHFLARVHHTYTQLYTDGHADGPCFSQCSVAQLGASPLRRSEASCCTCRRKPSGDLVEHVAKASNHLPEGSRQTQTTRRAIAQRKRTARPHGRRSRLLRRRRRCARGRAVASACAIESTCASDSPSCAQTVPQVSNGRDMHSSGAEKYKNTRGKQGREGKVALEPGDAVVDRQIVEVE